MLVELKKGTAKDTLLRVVVEIAAYALALRAGWSGLRNDWTAAVKRLNPAGDSPSEWKRCQLVCAAPQIFWDRKVGFCGEKDRVPKKAWKPFLEVLRAFDGFGLTFEFVSIEIDGKGKAGLPRVISAKPVPLVKLGELMVHW